MKTIFYYRVKDVGVVSMTEKYKEPLPSADLTLEILRGLQNMHKKMIGVSLSCMVEECVNPEDITPITVDEFEEETGEDEV